MLKEVKVIGKLDGNFRFDNMARVYDKRYAAPTINCNGGGDRQPKVIRNAKDIRTHRGRGGAR